MIEEIHNISREDFIKIIEQLKIGKNDLFNYHFQIIAEYEIKSLVNKYEASEEDIKDAVIQALYKIYIKLKEEKLQFININNYFSKIAYVELMIILNAQKATFSIDQNELFKNIPSEENDEVVDIFSEENYSILSIAFKNLNIDCQNILEAYFLQNKDYTFLSKKFKISYDAIRKKKHRCIQYLKENVAKEIQKK